jgi:hypothetical protein
MIDKSIHRILSDEFPNEDNDRVHMVLTSIARHIREKKITNKDQLHTIIDNVHKILDHFVPLFEEQIVHSQQCIHEFKHPGYTVRRMLMGYITVFERECKHCGFRETFTVGSEPAEPVDLPEWTTNARKLFWNNDF